MFVDNYTRGVWICFSVDDSQEIFQFLLKT